MKRTELKEAEQIHLDQIYMMGIDAWSEGSSEREYLDGCRNSPKYKKGTWYVLLENNEPISSLITYNFDEDFIGIGSISTPKSLQGRGYASSLISGVIDLFLSKNKNAIFYLYADISPLFYERFGFKHLSKEFQKHEGSICMVRSSEQFISELVPESVPKYF